MYMPMHIRPILAILYEGYCTLCDVEIGLARLEARIVLEELLRATQDFTLADRADVRHANSIFVRRLARLPLDLHPAA